MSLNLGYSQHLSSSRSIGLAAATVYSNDLSSLDWNPAALTHINDWELSVTNYYSPTGSNRSLTLQTLGIGKQLLLSIHAAAFKLSPGSTLDFIVPSTFVLDDSSQSLQFDKKISYSEEFTLGYAYRLRENLSLGLSLHVFDEKVTDTKYVVDTNFTIKTSLVNYSGNRATIDLGALWSVDETWKVGVVVKNLFNVIEKNLDESVQQYELTTPSVLRVGVGYSGLKNTLIAMDGDTKRQLRAGEEFSLSSSIQLRGGIYLDASSAVTADAIVVGVGTTFQPVHLDVSYLTFFSQGNRRGEADINAFLESGVSNIEFNQFTSDRLSLTARVNFGKTHESFARIEYVDITSDIFPASRMLYALQPIGKVRVRNVTTKPVDVKVSFYVDYLMDAPTQTQPQLIQPGEAAELPLYAVFNDAIKSVSSLSIRESDVLVAVVPNDEYNDRYQTRVLVHGKNDWNGDVLLLKYFVTPDDQEILRFTRDILSQRKAAIDTMPGILLNLERAKILFNEFTRRLTYVNDPKKSEDFVQYPSQTLKLNGGDCDDMSVCYLSLLASMGISTAFIDVVPPERPEQSHIYMMFDTGVDAKHAHLISDNPQRYVIRKDEHGNETVWIPIETTAITKGFADAWDVGAKEYFNDVELNLGIVKGWVKLVDFEAVN